MFIDDMVYKSFFRRADWSPDGSFFLTPASYFSDKEGNSSFTVYGFFRSQLTKPAFMLPKMKSYAVSIKFNPYIFTKTEDAK